METDNGDVPRTGESAGSDNWEEMIDAPHAVVAAVTDIEAARAVVEDLEKQGIPPDAIGLIGAASDERSDVPDSEAFSDLGKSVTAGGAGGALIGGVLGSLVTLAIPGVGVVVAAGLGAVFGAAVGGAAGGITVTKYASPAWMETFETVERGEVAVGVHHADGSVVDDAQTVMEGHDVSRISRFGAEDSEGRS